MDVGGSVGADSVERAKGKILNRIAEEVIEALLHLPGCFVGEGYRQNVIRVNLPDLDKVGDPMGNDPGFATPGAGKDKEWPIGRLYRFPLRRV